MRVIVCDQDGEVLDIDLSPEALKPLWLMPGDPMERETLKKTLLAVIAVIDDG